MLQANLKISLVMVVLLVGIHCKIAVGTEPYIIADDMENYNDRDDIREVWRDGNADVVWGGIEPYLFLVQGGSSGSNLNVSSAVGGYGPGGAGPIPPTPLNYEAMVLRYDNDGYTYTGLPGLEKWVYDAPYYSEIEANTIGTNSLDVGQNWNDKGFTSLSMLFQGHPVSDGYYDATAWPAYTVYGRGRDIKGRYDEFYYFGQYPLIGPGDVFVQVLRMDSTDPLAKAGVMIREKWTPYSKHASVFITPSSGITFSYRNSEDGPTTTITKPGVTAPEYLRLERIINGEFRAYHSDNAFIWYYVNAPGSDPVFPIIPMGTVSDPGIYIGSMVTSGNSGQICSADFDKFVINPYLPNWALGNIGTNDPERLYVALEDSAGNVGVVRHNDINAATLTTWQKWNIPLTEFTGVNLNSVKKIYIGLGDRDAPVQGGSGTLYIDDIRLYKQSCAFFVDADAPAGGNGSSWANAYNDLQSALAVAQVGDEILVAEGIYKPIPYIPPPPPPLGSSNVEESVEPAADRTTTFQLKNSVVIKGGYAGSGELDPNARDIDTYETILSGDIGIAGDNSDNSYHVVTGSGCDETAVLDGFTIKGGNGGVTEGHRGGGMYNYTGSPTLTNCTFSGNSTTIGGGMYNFGSSPTVTNCTFSGNSANFGGGMFNQNGSPTLTNCTFSNNSAELWGGGMANVVYSNPTLANCILWGNTAPSGAQIHNYDGTSSATVSYSDIQDGWPGTGNIDADPCFVQLQYFGPMAYWKFDEAGGTTAFDSAGSSHGTVYGPLWTGGLVDGALSFDGFDDYVRIGGNPALDDLSAITLEAWIYPERDSHWHILDKGDGDKRIYAEGTTLTLDGRVRYTDSHAFSRSVSNTLVLNTWQHVALTWSLTDHTTRLYHNGVEVNYSIRSIGTGFVLDDRSHLWTIGARGALGEVTFFDGLIDEAAIHERVLSVDEIRGHYLAGLSGQGYPGIIMPDYHLLEDSPCINTGDPDYPFDPNETDLDGKPRVIAGRIDMGAYEFNHIPVADAGPDQTVEAQAPWGATVTLDGSGSSDADSTPGTIDDINNLNWYEIDPCDPNFDVLLGSGQIIDCNLSIGEHIIILEVIDRAGASDTNEVTIIVQDTTPPTITCPGGERMVAYNDCVYRSGDQYIANNVTTYGIGSGFAGSTSGPLVDQVTGDDMDIMITLTESGGVNWLPDPANGGSDCAKGTDAYNTFGGIADMTGVIYYGSAGWWVDLTFAGLDPTTEYTFATSAARNNYSGRLTIYTLTGADTYTNASTIGVDVLAENKVRFNTGDNHNEGYVARWTGITATDGSFTVRAEADPCSTDGRKAYSFDVFMLEGVLPGDVTLECPADTNVAAIGSATATDTCGTVTITHSDQWQPSCGNAGTLARTWTATDESGNSSTCVQIITVVDTAPPVITCPPNVTLEYPADTSPSATGKATATDTCGDVTIRCRNRIMPGCGNTETIERTWIATDECDNSSSCVQVITVVDTTPPEFEFSVSPTMLWPPNHKMAEITPSWTVSDECDASPDVSLVSIVANEGDDVIGDGHTSDDIQIDDDGSIFVRSERSGTNTGRIYTITYQAVDDCGNVTVRSATVSIPHEFKLLARIAARWLWANPSGRIPEDLNGDGIVNLKDIAIFANNWIQ